MSAALDVGVVVVTGFVMGLYFGWRGHADLRGDGKPLLRSDVITAPPSCPYCEQLLERRRHVPDAWLCDDCPVLSKIARRPIDYVQHSGEQALHQLAKLKVAR